MKKIRVADGNSIINRAFYGIRPLTTKSGKHTNAIYGMINMISHQISALKPDYVAVAFDLKAPTFRHKMYDGYKAGRHPTPPELLSQFPDAKECLRYMGIHVLELAGYEADDIQGTIAKMAHTAVEETESYILTGDRDLLQLIDPKITVLLAGNKDTTAMHEEQFSEKYGVLPSQFVDMKALMGDSSDNIPGVAGVGEKTAANLIKAFGTLDGIYENIADAKISKGVREKLVRDKDNAYLSQTLARIKTDVPIISDLNEISYNGPDKRALYAKFTELELNSFIVKFGLDGDDDAPNAEGDEKKYDFRNVSADELVQKSGNRFAVQEIGDNLYFYNKTEENLVFSGDFSEISDIFTHGNIICYDAKSFIKRHGISTHTNARFLDIMMYAYLLNPGGGVGSVESLASMFLGYTVAKDAPCPEVLFELEAAMRAKIRECGMEYVLDELELPLVPILAEIERTGFKINCEGMLEYSEALGELADGLKQGIYMQAGEEFNINSPKQLGDILFVRLGLPCKKKTKSGDPRGAARGIADNRRYSRIQAGHEAS